MRIHDRLERVSHWINNCPYLVPYAYIEGFTLKAPALTSFPKLRRSTRSPCRSSPGSLSPSTYATSITSPPSPSFCSQSRFSASRAFSLSMLERTATDSVPPPYRFHIASDIDFARFQQLMYVDSLSIPTCCAHSRT